LLGKQKKSEAKEEILERVMSELENLKVRALKHRKTG